MKKAISALLLSAILLLSLSACGAAPEGEKEDGVLTVAATTYPVYLLAEPIVGNLDGIELKLVVNQQISCLHDYTLSVQDMRTLSQADVILMNGAGLEEFLDDVLNTLDVPVIDCSAGIELLPSEGHEDHDHGHDEDADDHDHYDPHIWMDPHRATQMMTTIAENLAAVQDTYSREDLLEQMRIPAAQIDEMAAEWKLRFDALPEAQRKLITFHDGFAYFADAFDLEILKAIEEESGSEASAKEIKEIVGLVREYHIPTIFTEENGSSATAKAIQRETGTKIGTLSMLMSADGPEYLQAMEQNLQTVYTGLTGEEIRSHAE